MTRRSSPRPLTRQRRSLLVIAIVVLTAVVIGFALIPGATAPKTPLFCPYGEVILNNVRQCLPFPPPSR
ncbi:MAG: hypothetical protein M3P84_12490 [Chloroflexota bacterium]|nr:hypothetical protein [Chloroflexota bacterium]